MDLVSFETADEYEWVKQRMGGKLVFHPICTRIIYTWASCSTVNVSKKYSAIGNSAIGNYVVLYSKLILKTVLLEVSYGKND